MNRVFLIVLFLLSVNFVYAGVSLITSAVVVGGDKVHDYDLESTLDSIIRKMSAGAGEGAYEAQCSIQSKF